MVITELIPSEIKDQLRELWEEHSKVYKDGLSRVHVFKEGAELLRDVLPKCSRGRIHEGGCGDGYWMIQQLIKCDAKEIVGTDLSSGMLERARGLIQNLERSLVDQITVQEIDLLSDWPKGTFNLQVFQMFLCYLPCEGWRMVLDKAAETTLPGGYICSSNFVEGCNFGKTYREHLSETLIRMNPFFYIPFLIKTRPFTRKIDYWLDQEVLKYPSPDELLEHHQRLGLEVVEIKEFFWGGGIIVKARKA